MTRGCNSTEAKNTLGGHAGLGRCLALCAVLVGLLVAVPAAGAATFNVQSVPTPHSPNGQGFSVSCSSSTSCMAVGFSINSLGEQRPLAETWNGTSWTVQAVPMPPCVHFPLLSCVSYYSANAC